MMNLKEICTNVLYYGAWFKAVLLSALYIFTYVDRKIMDYVHKGA